VSQTDVIRRAFTFVDGSQTLIGVQAPYRFQAQTPVFNVKDYGAHGDGSRDDTTTIAAAITAAAASGGIVHAPPGTYLVSGNLGGALSNVTVQGAGRFVTIFKLKASSNTHVFDISGNNWTMRDIGIDGNRANNASGHGIRITGDHHTLDTLYIHDTVGYGIANAQGASDILRYATYTNLYVKNTGVDGIDIKDHLSSNTANRLTNITIDGIDLSGTQDCAGIDCRGPVQLSNITVILTTHGSTNGSAIRFRETSVSTGPVGGYQSTLANARIIGDDTTSMYGVAVNAQGVNVSNVYVNDIWRAYTVGVDAAQVALVNCVAEDANSRGFEISTTTDEDVSLTGCRALDCATSFYVTSNDVNLIGCISRDASSAGFDIRGDRIQVRGGRISGSAGTALSINASADATQVSGLDVSRQTAGTKLSNSGTNTSIRDCAGLDNLDTSRLYARNDTTLNLVDDTSNQAIFPSTYDELTVIAGATYRFRCVGRIIKGTTSVTISWLFGGTATFTTCNWAASATCASASTPGTATLAIAGAAAATQLFAGNVSTNIRWVMEGEFEINAGGTIIPQITFGGATGATPVVQLGTFFEAWQVGSNPVTATGPWA
jgi:hypothetical protein